MKTKMRAEFECWCKANDVHPEGQFAVEDGWPIWQAAFEAGAAAMQKAAAIAASRFSVKPDRSLHPDIPWEQMNEAVKVAAHSTAQQIALEIATLSTKDLGG